jgi:hypothetical protein
MWKTKRLLQTFFDPARAMRSPWPTGYASVEAGPLLQARRLEERRVLAVDATDALADAPENSLGITGSPQPLTVPPVVTAPSNQATVEGLPLVFSAATGRLIRIDDPDIGTNPLVVDLTAFEAQGGPSPSLTLASTFGLISITGNGTNVLRLEGTLANINAALAHLTFYSIDNGNFTVTITASDVPNGEADSASFQVQTANVAPQAAFSGNGGVEGTVVSGTIEVFDPGILDDPQVNWVVSYDGTAIAQGVGPAVAFLAARDGIYHVAATAVDKDGATFTHVSEVIVSNVAPTFDLEGFIRDGVVHLTLIMNDPGQEDFIAEVFWTEQSTTPQTFHFSNRVLMIDHRYTAEELESAVDGLVIAVNVSDGESHERRTLQFREGAGPDVAPPEFEAAPLAAPLERLPLARLQPTNTAPQVVSSDLGGSSAQGKQAEVAIQQFVLRVVGPDGEESGDYVLPGDALENLPAFLSTLGVPDGHYRIYLVTGELERLVIDAHLRGGRMIDPRDESQPTIDRPPASDEAAQLAGANTTSDELVEGSPNSDVELVAVPVNADAESDAGQELPDDHGNRLLPLWGGTIVVGAATAGLATLRTPSRKIREASRGFPRFTKAARRARKITRM